MVYQLYYWPDIQGRGEFVRLALEEAGAEYKDVARKSGSKSGVPTMMQIIDGPGIERPPFAPPFLKADDQIIAQTANILLFLGSRHGLAPEDEAGRLWVHQLQLMIADLVVEAHDTHHPIGVSLYYEDQIEAARRRAADFRANRIPKFLGYFQRVLDCNSAGPDYLVGDTLTYADLSLFQVVAGLRYAFPKAMRHIQQAVPGVVALHKRVAKRPRIKAYLASPRRLSFNEEGIFRHYPELDAN